MPGAHIRNVAILPVVVFKLPKLVESGQSLPRPVLDCDCACVHVRTRKVNFKKERV